MRQGSVERKTNETNISGKVNLDHKFLKFLQGSGF